LGDRENPEGEVKGNALEEPGVMHVLLRQVAGKEEEGKENGYLFT
jgi:hypothetical protein